MNNRPGRANSQQPTAPSQQSGQWYFYNPQAVSQGKQTFQRQWGKRENKDHWQRVNQTVVNLLPESTESTDSIETSEMPEMADSQGATAPSDSIAGKEGEELADSAANKPYMRNGGKTACAKIGVHHSHLGNDYGYPLGYGVKKAVQRNAA